MRKRKEDEARVWEKANAVQRAAAEAATKIRVKKETEIAKIGREEAEARSKADTEIKEKAKKMSKEREAKAKAEAEFAERAR